MRWAAGRHPALHAGRCPALEPARAARMHSTRRGHAAGRLAAACAPLVQPVPFSGPASGLLLNGRKQKHDNHLVKKTMRATPAHLLQHGVRLEQRLQQAQAGAAGGHRELRVQRQHHQLRDAVALHRCDRILCRPGGRAAATPGRVSLSPAGHRATPQSSVDCTVRAASPPPPAPCLLHKVPCSPARLPASKPYSLLWAPTHTLCSATRAPPCPAHP